VIKLEFIRLDYQIAVEQHNGGFSFPLQRAVLQLMWNTWLIY